MSEEFVCVHMCMHHALMMAAYQEVVNQINLKKNLSMYWKVQLTCKMYS